MPKRLWKLSVFCIVTACSGGVETSDESTATTRTSTQRTAARDVARANVPELVQRLRSSAPWTVTEGLFLLEQSARQPRTQGIDEACGAVPELIAMTNDATMHIQLRQRAGEIVVLLDCPRER